MVRQRDHLCRNDPRPRRREGGDGGFVEVSSHGQLAFTGNVELSAPRGTTGTLLLDPQDLLISSVCDGGSNCMNPAQIETQLATQNVVIATNPQLEGNGDIFALGGTITWSSNNSLTLSAFRDINIGAFTIQNTASGNLVLRAEYRRRNGDSKFRLAR